MVTAPCSHRGCGAPSTTSASLRPGGAPEPGLRPDSRGGVSDTAPLPGSNYQVDQVAERENAEGAPLRIDHDELREQPRADQRRVRRSTLVSTMGACGRTVCRREKAGAKTRGTQASCVAPGSMRPDARSE